MTNLLLEAPTTSSPQRAITLSQRAPAFISSQSSWLSAIPYPFSLFINTESQEKWQSYENLLLACLRTGDDETAYDCLKALITRFGENNERVLALSGVYQEATAKNEAELMEILKTYEEILKDDPTIFSLRKRRAALLRSMGRTSDAVTALTNLLDQSPTDAEAWSELADLYFTQGSYEQAVFCLEEVVLVAANSWNMHARLGEVLYISAGKAEGAEQLRLLADSMRRFCRSLELCDDYLRGFYGLKLTTTRLLEALSTSKKSHQTTSEGDLALPSLESVKKLNELATAKLAEIVRRGTSGQDDGYDPAELAAAKALLDKSTLKIER